MGSGKEPVRFSPNGEFLAVGGSDGHLRIWETATNRLSTEFIPPSHLAASCTCIEWSPTFKDNASTSKKKKKKRRVLQGDLLVMGTSTGKLLFYDVSKSEALAQPNNSGTGPGNVNAVAWCPWTLNLYSCGADGVIREWNPELGSVSSSWVASKENLTAIQVISETQCLVGGQTITLWDITSKKSLASFVGHPNQISQIEVVPSTDYFVSMAQNDRHLKIWQCSNTSALVSLSVREVPVRFGVHVSDNGTASVGVVTRKGQLHIFQQKLNGHVRKPLSPVANLVVIDGLEDDKESAGETVPVVASQVLMEGSNINVVAAYGNLVRLRFEKFDFKSLLGNQIIRRDVLVKAKVGKKSKLLGREVDAVNRVEVPNDVKHLMPGSESSHALPGSSKAASAKKKQTNEDDGGDGDLPMEERLTNLTIDAPSRGDVPKVDNLGHLLSQGLHSKDSRILQSVLHRSDEKVITNTIRTFPVQLVVPLIGEIKVLLGGKSMENHALLKWLKAILQIHSSYLMSCVSNEELVGPIVALLRSREILYPQLCSLKGKLELIKGNVAARQYKSDLPNEALLTYQDESTDDEDQDEDGMLPSESEDFLTSDDLGPDDDDTESDEDDKEGDSEGSTEESSGESDEANSHAGENGKPNSNGIEIDGGSDESMDED